MSMKATQMETTTTTKEDQEGDGKGKEDRAKKRSVGFQNHLELRLGISLNNGFQDQMVSSSKSTSGGLSSTSFLTSQEGLVLQRRSSEVGPGGSKRWLSETGAAACGFVHPWSLAARQEKAALEQALHKPSIPSHTTSLPRATAESAQAQPVVGWPPVRTFRRNLAGSQPAKPEMEKQQKDATNQAKPLEMEKVINNNIVQPKPTMFVKVNMEGYAVGRKIDLKAHDSYESLSRTLQRMFQNFLSVNIHSIMTKEDEQAVEAVNQNYILLYEDNEGDRMLVGDVPWEMFITSVKRLHIALDPRAMSEAPLSKKRKLEAAHNLMKQSLEFTSDTPPQTKEGEETFKDVAATGPVGN
ncbi:hypothetical protein J5N97_020093 [Dioscorea zingiberensis]|uniref:Auxin-responsive protein n=1 Tax=Dioscorea zingiberensis TaxID=325984 RepID=A0A9D5CFZ3_9LILI|nr:hypothetical protein J5N97_020093 [Dioscorea zingiberensis]